VATYGHAARETPEPLSGSGVRFCEDVLPVSLGYRAPDIMKVPVLWKGTSRIPIGVFTSTVPSAR